MRWRKKIFPPQRARGTRQEVEKLARVLDRMLLDIPTIVPPASVVNGWTAGDLPSEKEEEPPKLESGPPGAGGEFKAAGPSESGFPTVLLPHHAERRAAWDLRLEHNVCMVGLHEAGRQVAAHCAERGALVARLAERAGQLMETLPGLYETRLTALADQYKALQQARDAEVGALAAEVSRVTAELAAAESRHGAENARKVAALNAWNVRAETLEAREKDFEQVYARHIGYRSDAEGARMRVQRLEEALRGREQELHDERAALLAAQDQLTEAHAEKQAAQRRAAELEGELAKRGAEHAHLSDKLEAHQRRHRGAANLVRQMSKRNESFRQSMRKLDFNLGGGSTGTFPGRPRKPRLRAAKMGEEEAEEHYGDEDAISTAAGDQHTMTPQQARFTSSGAVAAGGGHALSVEEQKDDKDYSTSGSGGGGGGGGALPSGLELGAGVDSSSSASSEVARAMAKARAMAAAGMAEADVAHHGALNEALVAAAGPGQVAVVRSAVEDQVTIVVSHIEGQWEGRLDEAHGKLREKQREHDKTKSEKARLEARLARAGSFLGDDSSSDSDDGGAGTVAGKR
eukprot:g6022.t1